MIPCLTLNIVFFSNCWGIKLEHWCHFCFEFCFLPPPRPADYRPGHLPNFPLPLPPWLWHLPPVTDIWWLSLETCSNLFTWWPTPTQSPLVLTPSGGHLAGGTHPTAILSCLDLLSHGRGAWPSYSPPPATTTSSINTPVQMNNYWYKAGPTGYLPLINEMLFWCFKVQ